MGKGIIIGAVVVVAAAAATPYGLGIKAEQMYQQQLAEAQQQGALSGDQFTLEPVSYQRGWLESEAVTRLTINHPDLDAPILIDLYSQIMQLPDVAGGNMVEVITKVLPVDAEQQKSVSFYFKDAPPLTITSQIAFDGSQTNLLHSPSYQGPAEQSPESQIHWQGLEGRFHGSADMANGKGELSAPGLSVVGPELNIEMGALRVAVEGQRHSSGLWLGDTDMTLASLAMSAPTDEKQLRINNLTINAINLPEGDNLDGEVSIRVSSIDVDDYHIGESGYTVALKSLHLPTLQEFQQHNARMQKMSPEELMADEQLKALLVRMLENSPEVAMKDIQVSLPEGELLAELRVHYLDKQQGLPQSPQQIVAALDAEVHATIPAKVLKMMMRASVEEQVDLRLLSEGKELSEADREQMIERATSAQIGFVMMSGYLQESGENYTLDASLSDNKAMLNGNDMSPMLDALLAQ